MDWHFVTIASVRIYSTTQVPNTNSEGEVSLYQLSKHISTTLMPPSHPAMFEPHHST